MTVLSNLPITLTHKNPCLKKFCASSSELGASMRGRRSRRVPSCDPTALDTSTSSGPAAPPVSGSMAGQLLTTLKLKGCGKTSVSNNSLRKWGEICLSILFLLAQGDLWNIGKNSKRLWKLGLTFLISNQLDLMYAHMENVKSATWTGGKVQPKRYHLKCQVFQKWMVISSWFVSATLPDTNIRPEISHPKRNLHLPTIYFHS